MKKSILVCAILLLSSFGYGDCPTADLSGDCYVDLEDFAVMANEWVGQTSMTFLYDMARQWLTGTPGSQGMVFVAISGGTFEMGDHFGDGVSYERPVHTVTLSPFRMSKYEVTNGQYAEYLNAANTQGLIKVSEAVVYAASDDPKSKPYFDTYSYDSESQIDYVGGTFTVRSKSDRDMSNDPVVHVSWFGAKAFCDYYGYRLSTEAEWEFAARGGLSGQRFPWGNTISHSLANYQSSSSYSYDVSPTRGFHPSYYDVEPYKAPVGSFTVNGYGLCDMSGNVWELCNDWYSSSYYNDGPQHDPKGPASGSSRVLRGGSWWSKALRCRVAARTGRNPDQRWGNVGFRCALDF